MANKIRTQTLDIFEPIAKKYDFLNRLFSLHFDTIWRKTLVWNVQKNIKNRYNINLLDIGCGTGDIIKYFKKYSKIKFSSITGIDISTNMLNIANKTIDNCSFLKADATNLPFKNSFFDIIATAFVIRNINNLNLLFTEIYRVLKNDGIFAFLEFSIPKNYLQKTIFINYLHLWIKNIGDYYTKSKSYTHLSKSIIEFDKINLINILTQLNFNMIRYQHLTNGIVQLGIFKK